MLFDRSLRMLHYSIISIMFSNAIINFKLFIDKDFLIIIILA